MHMLLIYVAPKSFFLGRQHYVQVIPTEYCAVAVVSADTFCNDNAINRITRYFGEISTHWRRDKMDAISQIFKCIILYENVWIPIWISLKFVPKGPINNIPALVQTMTWRRPGDKPLSEPMIVRLPTHICVTQPQWVNMGSTLCVTWDKITQTISKHCVHYVDVTWTS